MPTIADRKANATRRAVAAAALVLAALAAPGAACAQDAYSVRGVAIDATADAAADARDKAISQGHLKAYRILIHRLVPRSWRSSVPHLSEREVTSLVTDFGIEDEKRSTVRYLATLTFQFDRHAVRQRLRAAGVPFAETVRPPMLVIPVYRRAGASLLWDKPNPWRTAWETEPDRDGLVPFIVPEAGLQDIVDISARQALDYDSVRVADIAARYGTDGAVVATATLRTDPASNAPVLTVKARVFESRIWKDAASMTLRPEEGETVDALLKRGVSETADTVTDLWRMQNLLRFDQPGSLEARAPVSTLTDLRRLEQEIGEVAVVGSTTLIALSRDSAWLRIDHFGGVEQLRAALTLRGVLLEPDSEGGWTIRFGKPPEQASGR